MLFKRYNNYICKENKKKDMNVKNRKISYLSLGLGISVIIGFAIFSSFKVSQKEATGVVMMNKKMYVDKIYDFGKSPNVFKYKGSRPAVVDFYADWCRPCRRVAPIMEELSKQYAGKVDFYKVNVDLEPELAAVHEVQSIPMVAIFSNKGNPKITMGALNKDEYITLIEEILK